MPGEGRKLRQLWETQSMKTAEVLCSKGMDNQGVITLWKQDNQLPQLLTVLHKNQLDTSVPMSKNKTDKHPKTQPTQSHKCTWEDCVEARKYCLENYQ